MAALSQLPGTVAGDRPRRPSRARRWLRGPVSRLRRGWEIALPRAPSLTTPDPSIGSAVAQLGGQLRTFQIGHYGRVTGIADDDRDLDLRSAFPASIRDAVERALDLISPAEFKPLGSRTVNVDGEQLVIPYRIYNPERGVSLRSDLNPVERAVLNCLYTRHHNGRVRQAHVEAVIGTDWPWVVPYVVTLIGEYVEEIIASIATRLDLDTTESPERERYGRFVATNPAFFETTSRRVTSYWNCYYRFKYPAMNPDERFPRYPGFDLVDKLRRAGEDAERSLPGG